MEKNNEQDYIPDETADVVEDPLGAMRGAVLWVGASTVLYCLGYVVLRIFGAL